MKDDFKDKLKKYKEGKLSDEESKEIEQELDKLEIYQEFMNKEFNEIEGKETQREEINYKKMIKKGKWKARFNIAITAIAIFMVFSIILGIITSVFYNTGTPNRRENYIDAIKSTIYVTRPNLNFSSVGTSQENYFTMNVEGKLEKQVGDGFYDVGELDGKFLFNKVNSDIIQLDSIESIGFIHPEKNLEYDPQSDWEKLEKLHEGTVAEVYVSFDKLYKTDEILEKIEPSKLNWLWAAVDIGDAIPSEMFSNIGFTSKPMWREGDGITYTEETEDTLFGTQVVSESTSYSSVDPYGSGKLRDKNFLETLEFLNEYKDIAGKVDYTLGKNINSIINHIEENGVKIYGMVITGPTKDILKLKEEDYITNMRVKDVKLWNLN